MGDSTLTNWLPVILRLSDPSYTERLSAFMQSLGHRTSARGTDYVELEREIPEDELRIYLKVWSVLHPQATITVG